MASIGKGFAKTILFGEHFVVYGLVGIASGLDKFVQIEAKKINSDDVVFDDKQFKEKISMQENPDHIKCKIFNAMFLEEEFVPKKGVRFIINSNFSPGGGLGYSSAFCVALARSMNKLFNQDFNDEKINELAFLGEKVAHGNPSGIDNTCSTYGTTITFEKNLDGGKNKTKVIKCAKSLYCVLANTGVKHKTSEAVEEVKKFSEENPNEFSFLSKKYKSLVIKARKEIQFGGVKEIGKLMNENHELLKELGVSIPQTEEIIRIANFEGALGAKITGAGKGGNVLILCDGEKTQDKVITTLANKGFDSIKTRIS